MNKKLIKDLKIIAKNYKHHNEYIDIAKYIIFLVTKMVFLLKINNIELNDFSYRYYLDNKEDDLILKLFNEYDCYDLSIIEIEEETFMALHKNLFLLTTKKFIPGILYESMLTGKEKNLLGQVYTPNHIIKEMLDNVLTNIDESFKIIDPACGGGYFLIEAFNKIKENLKGGSNIPENEIDKYILGNMIYGNDMDKFSVFLTKTGLLLNCMCYNVKLNIFNTDFLLKWNESKCNDKFDIIIGNPPYIGHKKAEIDYKKELQKKYEEVYYDKSDVSYCFFQKGKELLKKEGILSYITSRYFMEALYGQRLRKFINSNFSIVAITDFNGIKVFKNVNVSPVIIVLKNKNKNCKISKNEIDYIRYNNSDKKPIEFKYNQSNINSRYWNMLSDEELNIFNKIDGKCSRKLKDICDINQGIITGCDKAFIVTTKEIETFKLEKRLIQKWIKNSNIKNDVINFDNKHIIYSDLIDDERKYPNTIKYLLKYKDQLEKRRECRKGIRKWYQLQWGRDLDKFRQSKIVFPYKSNSNKFCFDNEGYLCSADVYIITNVNKQVSYEYLTSFLNSKIFEFYFKCVGKKVGEKLFEYYPNKINDLGIFIYDNRKTMGKNTNNSIDKMLFKVLNISKEEEQIIDNYIR